MMLLTLIFRVMCVPAGKYLIDVTPEDDNETIVTTARAWLPGAGGASVVIFASGFLSPEDEADNARGFKLMYALLMEL